MSLRMFGQASTSMYHLQQQLDQIGHNLSNLQSPGYKARNAEFSSLLSQHINNLTANENSENRLTPDGIRVGTGGRLGSINYNFQVGAAQRTDRSLDVMLTNERQFFEVIGPDGNDEEILLTRDGSFYLNPVGDNTLMLVTKDGHPVNGLNGPIQFASQQINDIQINDNGMVIVNRNGQQEVVGTIAVTEVIQPRLLEAVGDNFLRIPNLTELGINEADIIQAPPNGNLMQSGVLEMSNVKVEDQMSQMMMAQRAYQFNARSISMADQMQGLINNIR